MDGGYIVGGGPKATNTDDGMFLMKINATGDTSWTRNVGATSGNQASQRIKAVDQGSDGTYYVGGFTEAFGTTFDFCVARLDNNGDTLWTRNLDHPQGAHDYCYAAQVSMDNNFVTFGRQGKFEVNYYLNKWDTSGNIIWSKFYSIQNNHDSGNSMHQTSDGGFIMAGITENNSLNIYNTLVAKTDSVGNLEWAKTYVGSAEEECNAVKQVPDGGFLIAGTTQTFGSSFQNVFVIKTDSLGDTLWTRTYSNSGNPIEAYALNLTNDNGFIITGRALYNSVYLVPLIRGDSLGNILWAKYYGLSGGSGFGNAGHDVIQTIDGGFIICGYTRNSGDWGGYLIKTDQFGNSGCNEDTVTLNQGYAPFQVTTVTLATGSNALVKYPPNVVTKGATVFDFCSGVGVEEFNSNSESLQLYPNPSAGVFEINFDQFIIDGYLTIYNMFGENVFELKIENINSIEISINNLKSGVYLVKLFDGKAYSSKKIIKL